MFEFLKLCNLVEGLTPAERTLCIAEKSASVVHGLRKLDVGGADPVDVLAAFIMGSVISDGSISEKDLLGVYPALEEALGQLCDLAEIKRKIKVGKDVQAEVNAYVRQLQQLVWAADEELAADVVMLCLLVTSVDGKVSLKERRYIKQLCKE